MNANAKERLQLLVIRARHWSYSYNNAAVANNYHLQTGITGAIDPEKEANKALAIFDSMFNLDKIERMTNPLPKIKFDKCETERCSLAKGHEGVHFLK